MADYEFKLTLRAEVEERQVVEDLLLEAVDDIVMSKFNSIYMATMYKPEDSEDTKITVLPIQ